MGGELQTAHSEAHHGSPVLRAGILVQEWAGECTLSALASVGTLPV
jgi:hypothetical protein